MVLQSMKRLLKVAAGNMPWMIRALERRLEKFDNEGENPNLEHLMVNVEEKGQNEKKNRE